MSDWTYHVLPDGSVEALVKQACDDIQKLVRTGSFRKTAEAGVLTPPQDTAVTSPVPNRAPPLGGTKGVPSTGPAGQPAGQPKWEQTGDLSHYVQDQVKQVATALRSSRDALKALIPVWKQKQQLAAQIASHLKQMNSTVQDLTQNMPNNPMAQRMSRWWGSTLGNLDPTRVNPEKLLVVISQMAQNMNQFSNFRGSYSSDENQWNAGQKLFNQPKGRPGSVNRPLLNTLQGEPMDMFPRHNEQYQTAPPQTRKGIEQELGMRPSQPPLTPPRNPMFPNMKPKKPNLLDRMLGRRNRAEVVDSGKFFKSASNESEWYWKLG